MASKQIEPTSSASPVAASGNKDNQLLAGYLAHEFLTEGTLLGQKWDAARAEAIPINPRKTYVRRPAGGAAAEVKGGDGSIMVQPQQQQKKIHSSYVAAANLLRSEGVHIEGIVNPTQLARWLQM